MKYKYKTRKIKRQKGRGILRNGIKSKTQIDGLDIPYTKKCPSGTIMCDQDEINYALCVPEDRQELCNDPNYEFKYVPPDESDRNALKPINRLIREENGKGPINDPIKPVKVFEIDYDGEYDEMDTENPKNKLLSDIMINEETGRLKSYTPEFHPTSCAIQQKAKEATIEVEYNTGDSYKRRIYGEPITLELSPIPPRFKILTQNALGLYRGVYGELSEQGSANEATYDLMRLRTALLRNFLKTNSPDFICLQESTRTFIDLLDKDPIPQMYQYIYPTEEEMIRLESFGANATTSFISKYSAKKATTYMLQGNSSYFNALGVYEFDNLAIFNVYMQAGSEISPGQKYRWENYSRCRRQQLMFIKEKIRQITSVNSEIAIIVLGDFNFELNSIRYKGENSGRADRDLNNHLIYEPSLSDMRWAEHKFLVGPNGLNLNDSYKELHIDDPDKLTKEGLTENTDVNTFRFLGKLEEKALRYDGIFFNDILVPIKSEVVNNNPTILDSEPDTVKLFEDNRIDDYKDNIRKYNIEYDNFMIFNPKGNLNAKRKKDAFLSNYRTFKGNTLSIDNGFELFVSDHFGVITEFDFKGSKGGKRKNITRRRKYNRKKRKTKRH